MRTTLIAALLLSAAQVAAAQEASQEQAAPVLTIRLSADGICTFEDISLPCDQLARRLVSMHLRPNPQAHFSLDPGAKYEMVAAMLTSLREVGLKVGVVNIQSSQ
jgi:biopolymer transport protein ExbD